MYITLRRDQTTKSATRYDRPTCMNRLPAKVAAVLANAAAKSTAQRLDGPAVPPHQWRNEMDL
jgi:hypothetical protein